MEWLNIRIATLRTPEYIGSTPIERATWINVVAYSCEQENNGRLIGAADWKDRQWQQTCGVTAREIRAAGKLLKVEGSDVIVYAYPTEKQIEVQARRMQARDAARRRWDNNLGDAPRIPPSTTEGDAPRIPPRNAEREGEGEGEEEVEKEGELELVGQLIEPDLPFKSDAFTAAWALFAKHRRELRKPLTPTSTRMALKQLGSIGEQRAIACIELTVRMGWQGLREDNARGAKPARPSEFSNAF
jgi:hypothetical protein